MDTARPLQLLPALPMIAEELEKYGWVCHMTLADPDQRYRGVRLYHRKQILQKDVLYLLRPTEEGFPFDEFSYVSTADHSGKANHLVCPVFPDEEVLDQLLEIFARYRTWEEAMDLLLYRNASLQELCELGAQILENPVCIHDDWFVMMAMTAEFARLMEPEYLMSSNKGFVPRAVVEDFQTDSDYLETYAYRTAQLWQPAGKDQVSLYVNLWDGSVYKGRLLVAQKNREFGDRDFMVAEALTQRAMLLLRRKQPGEESSHLNMDGIVYSLLQGKQTDPSELMYLLTLLGWQRTDRFLCLRIKPQNSSTTLTEHLLHGDLFRCFPDSYILLGGHEQCVILNMSRNQLALGQVRHIIAPLCRDYCLYAGISSPVTGIREVQSAYYQAGAALEQAFRLRSEKWILFFAECSMEHILRNLPGPLTPGHLVAPEWALLADWDREKGTQYFDTLREYLLHERDIRRTSEALIIHRTTLLYRLQKIQGLIRRDLEDPWQRMHLILSLWILDQKK